MVHLKADGLTCREIAEIFSIIGEMFAQAVAHFCPCNRAEPETGQGRVLIIFLHRMKIPEDHDIIVILNGKA